MKASRNSERDVHDAPANMKSKVWEHFGFYKRHGKLDKSFTVCKLCKTELKYFGNTTNLSNHLRRLHGINTKISVDVYTADASSCSDECKPNFLNLYNFNFPENSVRAQAITESIARFICMDMQPYSVVENIGFREMLNTLEPRYTVPSCQVFSEICIPNLYESVKENLKVILSQSTHIALTTDTWKSCSTEEYVTITAHLISNNWQMQSYVLQTSVLNKAHTGKNLGELLHVACSEWEIADKEPALVTDNACSMILAGEDAGFNPHVTCFAHALNLMSQKAMRVKGVEQLLGRVRHVVSFFHQSSTALFVLGEKQKLLGLPAHKLKQDMCTRWNSSVEMLERFLEQQPAILATLMSKYLQRGTEVHTLSETDISNAEDIVKVMEPIKIATTVMCEDEQPTVSVIMPLQAKLMKHLEPCEDDTDIIREMKSVMSDDLSSRYTNIRNSLLQASALDPRFKEMPFLENDEKEFIFLKLILEASNSTKTVKHGDDFEEKPLITNEASSSKMVPSKKMKAMNLLFGNTYEQVPHVRSTTEVTREEVLRYRPMAPLPLSESAMEWWKHHDTEFPLLSNLARKYLCIPATSVAAERVFSTAGDIVATQRSILQPAHVDQLVFLKKNLS